MFAEQIPRTQPPFGFPRVPADWLMDVKAQRAPCHVWTPWAGGLVCHTPSPDCHNMADSQSRQNQRGTFCIYLSFSFTQKMEMLNMLKYWSFANFISSLSFHSLILLKSTELFQTFLLLSAEPIPAEYGAVKTFSGRFYVESGLSCTAVRQEEGTWYKFSTSWQQPGCKSFHSKAPWVTVPFEPPCEDF